MAMQAVEVASVGEVPDDGYWSASRLRVSYSEIGYSFDYTQHAFADKRIIQQPFHGVVTNLEVEEQEAN